MRQKYGILLLEPTEIIMRIYEADNKEWKLFHYQSKQVKNEEKLSYNELMPIVEILNGFFASEYAQHVGEWKACARFMPQPFIQTISSATGLVIENLSHLREQELLSKGMFVELW